MFTYAQRLIDERDHLTGMAQAAAEKAAGENRDLTETERASLAQWQERCANIDKQLEEHNVALESQRSWAALRAKLGEGTDDDPDPGESGGRHRRAAPAPKAWGEAFVESDQFRNYGGSGSSGRVEMPFGVLETRAAADPITTADLGGVIRPYRFEPPTPRFRSPLLDVIGRERVDVGSVEYFYFKPVPPDPAPVVAEGAVKPPANIEIESKAAALQTFAHWKAITRQTLEDYGRIRSIVEDKLRSGLVRALELATATAITDNADVEEVDGANLLEAIRKGMAVVQDNGYQANAVLLNSGDWASLDITVLAATFNGPVVGRSFWGLTPVASKGIASGEAFVGDFEDAVTLFDRNVTNVFLTDSHADFFVKNQLAILAETRALPAVIEPAAMVKATGAVAPPAR